MSLECSVVVPLCDEARFLPTLHLRLAAAVRRLAIPYEIIYVDDGSADQTPEIILELSEQDSAVKGIFLSRNFGRQAALCAGLEAAAGRAVVTMDGDLRDPPEVIPELLDRWRDGYQVVYARARRSRESLLNRFARSALNCLLDRVTETPVRLEGSDFALMDRRAVDELNSLPERTRCIRGLRSWVGFQQTQVEYDWNLPDNGHSRHSLARLVRLIPDSVCSFSDAPVKVITMLGCLITVLSAAGLVLGALGKLGLATVTAGPLLVGLALALLGGIQLIGLGLLGAYLSRVHREVRGRPMYVVREKVGFRSLPRPVPSVLDFLPSEHTERQEAMTSAGTRADWFEKLITRNDRV